MNYYLDTEFHEYQKVITTKGEIGEVVHKVNTIELISIGITSENNRDYYAICKDFDVEAAWGNIWLRDNVLKPIYKELDVNHLSKEEVWRTSSFNKEGLLFYLNKYGKTSEVIAKEIISYTQGSLVTSYGKTMSTKSITTPPVFHAYYADYDWVVFCWLFGSMIDLPNGFPMYCKDLKQELDNCESYVEENYSWYGSSTWLEMVKGLPTYPKQLNEHNALADAKWNLELHKFIHNEL